MPKLKTNKATKKRFKVTKNRKVFGPKSKRRHLLGDRSKGKKRRFRRPFELEPADREGVLKSLPYGGK